MPEKQKILVVHRPYRVRGGEDVFLEEILIPSLKKLNIPFELYQPGRYSILEIIFMLIGLESLRPSFAEFKRILNQKSFSAVLFNNFVPGISLGAAKFAQKKKIETYAWLHNMRMTCANGLNFDGKNVCTLCSSKTSFFALLKNCHRSRLQSFLYSWVYRFKRIQKNVVSHIDFFICNSEFTRKEFLRFNSSSESKTMVVRMPPPKALNPVEVRGIKMPYFLFIGRFSFEKGVDRFIDLAKNHPEYEFIALGSGDSRQLKLPNLNVINQSTQGQKTWLIQNASAVIVPSRVPETYSLVIAEAAAQGTPVIYPPAGGAEETFHLVHGVGTSMKDFNLADWIKKRSFEPKNLDSLNSAFENALIGFFG